MIYAPKNKCRLIIILSLSLFLLPGIFPKPCLAQNGAYHIGPRDILELRINAGGELQNQVNLTVSEKGLINVPYIGSTQVNGRTITELETIITEQLAKDYFVNPEVNISIKEYHSIQYFISGAVKSPGLYEMASQATLMELIAKAGGVLPERGNIAYILRASAKQIADGDNAETLLAHKEPTKVSLKSLLDEGDMRHNLSLNSGDVVYIPLSKALNLAESKIYVDGEVKSPGVFDYQPGMTALSACIMAGGFAKFAAPNRARIIRTEGDEQIVIKIDLNDVKKGEIPDIELKPGDRIHIPETWL